MKRSKPGDPPGLFPERMQKTRLRAVIPEKAEDGKTMTATVPAAMATVMAVEVTEEETADVQGAEDAGGGD